MVLRHWPPLSFGSTVQPGVFLGILHPFQSHPHLLSGGAALRSRTVGVFSASVGRPSPEHAPNWVGISLGLLPGSTRASCSTVGSAAPSALLTSTASIRKGNGWRTAPWNTNLECYKKKKIPKYSRRLRRIEVLNCCLSTSHILIINLCVNTCNFFLIFELDTQHFSVYLNTFRIL